MSSPTPPPSAAASAAAPAARGASGAAPITKQPYAAFLSHVLRSGGDQVQLLHEALAALGARTWFCEDEEPTLEGMKAGVRDSAAFLLFLSQGALASAAVRLEVGTALALGKPLVFVLERSPTPARPNPTDA